MVRGLGAFQIAQMKQRDARVFMQIIYRKMRSQCIDQ